MSCAICEKTFDGLDLSDPITGRFEHTIDVNGFRSYGLLMEFFGARTLGIGSAARAGSFFEPDAKCPGDLVITKDDGTAPREIPTPAVALPASLWLMLAGFGPLAAGMRAKH